MAFALSAACKKLDFQLTHLPHLQLNSTKNSFSDKPTLGAAKSASGGTVYKRKNMEYNYFNPASSGK